MSSTDGTMRWRTDGERYQGRVRFSPPDLPNSSRGTTRPRQTATPCPRRDAVGNAHPHRHRILALPSKKNKSRTPLNLIEALQVTFGLYKIIHYKAINPTTQGGSKWTNPEWGAPRTKTPSYVSNLKGGRRNEGDRFQRKDTRNSTTEHNVTYLVWLWLHGAKSRKRNMS